MVDEQSFKEIFVQFFPQGGKYNLFLHYRASEIADQPEVTEQRSTSVLIYTISIRLTLSVGLIGAW